jgi:endonuclease YncB( thermonuclease family)
MTDYPSTAQRWALPAFLCLLLAISAIGQESVVSARIVGITDGDTCKALVAGNQLLRIRLIWIDAPEKSQAFGQRSKQHLSNLIFGRQVELHNEKFEAISQDVSLNRPLVCCRSYLSMSDLRKRSVRLLSRMHGSRPRLAHM